MDVIPAIDIRDGKCVQLYQGDYSRETVYSESPVRAAGQWVALGATRLHVIDLDGARAGRSINGEIVAEIASAVPVPVQLGGGIRTVDAAVAAVAMGIDRVAIGTAAVESPDLIVSACRRLGADRVVLGLDARDGYVAVHGWTETSRVRATDLAERVEAAGVPRCIYTDIARDGTLTEPNWEAIGELVAATGMKVVVAGGVSSVEHLVRLAGLGVEAAIVGTAVYTGDIDLREAINTLRGA